MTFRTKTSKGEMLLGMVLTQPCPDLAEALSHTGLDWLFLDMEHATLSAQTVKTMMQAMHPDCLALVRVPLLDEVYIKQALDSGCHGIIIPMIRTAEDARAAVAWAKYAPAGARSVGISRAQGYGANFAACIEKANTNTALILQIEHRDAVDNIKDILAVDHIDGIFIGPYDLSGSLGVPGETTHPTVLAAIETVRREAALRKIPVGIFAATAEKAAQEQAANTAFVAVGLDVTHLVASAGNICNILKKNETA